MYFAFGGDVAELRLYQASVVHAMMSINNWAVYNSRIHTVHTSRVFLVLLTVIFLLAPLPSAGADDRAALEDQFAEKIISITGPGALEVQVTNRSSLSNSEVDSVRRGILKGLESFGARFVDHDQAAATVIISLSEDLKNYVWVAEIHQAANDASVAMISAPRPATSENSEETSALIIRKVSLWQSEEQILDAAEISGSPAHLLVLFPSQAILFKMQGSRWQIEQALPIVHSQPWPRDLRGRLMLRKDHLFDVYLPGIFCQSSGNAPLVLNCKPSDDPWPLAGEQSGLNGFFTPARNYFTGALSSGRLRTAPAFYSAASLPRDQYTLWMFAATDGQIHFLDGITDQAAKVPWGSDIASVHSGCGSGWQILASSPSGGADENVRAYEMHDREPVPVTSAILMGGGVSALWAASDGGSAIVVSRDREAGTYEAFRLSISCGQ